MTTEIDLSVFEELEIGDERCKNIIQSRLDEIQDNDDFFMQTLVDLKNDMYVTWEQPWYQRACKLTRRLEQDESQSETFRLGKITKAECEKINKNWSKFVKKFQVPDQPICLARWRSRNTHCKVSVHVPEEYVRRYVICYLARGLERNLNQVFQHFVDCHSAQHKGPYTKLELKVIKMCFYHFPKKTSQVASQILGRRIRGIRIRLTHELKEDSGLKVKPVKWDLEKASVFIKLLMKYTEVPLEGLKYKSIHRSVWEKVGQEFNKSAENMRIFWNRYLHVQLFVKCDLKINSLRRRAIRKLCKYPYEVWTDINWKELVHHFPDGITRAFIYDICTKVACGYKNYLTAPLDDVLEFMRKRIDTCRDKRLKTVILNSDGMLERIRYE